MTLFAFPATTKSITLTLTWGELSDACLDLGPFRRCLPPLDVHFDCASNTVQEQLRTERFLDEIKRTALQCLDRDGHLGVTGDHDDRDLNATRGQSALQVETTHARMRMSRITQPGVSGS